MGGRAELAGEPEVFVRELPRVAFPCEHLLERAIRQDDVGLVEELPPGPREVPGEMSGDDVVGLRVELFAVIEQLVQRGLVRDDSARGDRSRGYVPGRAA